jgi:hypothetical protein
VQDGGEVKTVTDKAKLRFVKEKDADTTADQEVIDQTGLCTVARAQATATNFAKCGNFAAASVAMDSAVRCLDLCSSEVKTAGTLTSTYFTSAQAYADNEHNNSALRMAHTKGRGSGGASTKFYVDNSVQCNLVNDFNEPDVSNNVNLTGAGTQNTSNSQSISASKSIDPLGTIISQPSASLAPNIASLLNALANNPLGQEEEKKTLAKKRSSREW